MASSATTSATPTIDVFDPLYPQSSDTPGINLITEQVIGNENCGIWSRAMVIALRAKNKLAFIDWSCKRPDSDSPTLMQWERCNALDLSWIMNGVSKEIFGGIVYSKDAELVWSDLGDSIPWEAESSHFPRLESLIIRNCKNLEEIPSGIGQLPTLKLIGLHYCGEKGEFIGRTNTGGAMEPGK